MAYKVLLDKAAEKTLDKLDAPVRKRILLFLVELRDSENPRSTGKALQNRGRLWRYRVGDYRLIADIQDKTITITVLKIGHRSAVYDQMQ